jgi:hypothetical protein
MPSLRRLLPLSLSLLLAVSASTPASAATSRATLFFVDGPLVDLADEGLPFRFTVAFPATLDPLTRALRASEARWTLGSGYAVVYDNFDTGTNTVRERGRDGLLFNAGRQTLWNVPVPLPAGALRLDLEAGLNYSARSLPANGTHLSFSLFAGLEWSSAPGDPREWIAGLRWFHLSHGGLFGQNGGYDGILFRVGRRWTF